MRRVVLDSSALLASLDVSKPEASDAMRHLKGEFEAVAPTLVAWELGNVVHGRRRAEFGRDLDERLEVVSALLEGVTLMPLEPGDLLAVGRDCEESGLTFYDAAFLELTARDDEAVLVTEDGALRAQALKRLGKGRARPLLGEPRAPG